jgi:hypothetical protein
LDFKATMEWQACNIIAINRLAKLGDKLALRLIEAYRAAYDDKLNIWKQDEWMKVCDDFARRELMLDTRRILQDRYGHKIPSEYKNIRV